MLFEELITPLISEDQKQQQCTHRRSVPHSHEEGITQPVGTGSHPHR